MDGKSTLEKDCYFPDIEATWTHKLFDVFRYKEKGEKKRKKNYFVLGKIKKKTNPEQNQPKKQVRQFHSINISKVNK